MYFNPEILILDEATSSLDENTEERVMESIKGLFDNKTSIIVAHRKSALINCNKIPITVYKPAVMSPMDVPTLHN